MSADSSNSTNRRKPWKPAKLSTKSPIFAHGSGRWAAKLNKQIYYVGRWGKQVKGAIVPVEDVRQSGLDAEKEFNRQYPWISKGLKAPPADSQVTSPQEQESQAGFTIEDLVTCFLDDKEHRVGTGELSQHTYGEYFRTCEKIVNHFGKRKLLEELTPKDFGDFRGVLAVGCKSLVTLKSKVNRARVVFKFASDNEHIPAPVKFGKAFDRPSEDAIRKRNNSSDTAERIFSVEELRKIIAGADPIMKAMALLGINCGFGNNDISSLPRKALDLDGGWVKFPRVKTGVKRRIPLWPETVEALRVALPMRPQPKDPADDGLCFITIRGTRYVRVQQSVKGNAKLPPVEEGQEKQLGKFVTINGLSRRFELLLDRLKIERRKGVGFYALRHCFETQAGNTGDQVVVDLCMGHLDPSMAANYRHGVDDSRLRKVVDHVRKWLFPSSKGKV